MLKVTPSASLNQRCLRSTRVSASSLPLTFALQPMLAAHFRNSSNVRATRHFSVVATRYFFKSSTHQQQQQQQHTNSSKESAVSSTSSSTSFHLKPYFNFKALQNPITAATMQQNIKDRHLPDTISVDHVNDLYRQVNDLNFGLDKLRAERNTVAKEMKTMFSSGTGKAKRGKNTSTSTSPTSTSTSTSATLDNNSENQKIRREELVERGRIVKDQIQRQEQILSSLESELLESASQIPNSTHPTSPIGPESEARLVRVQGLPLLNTSIDGTAVQAYAHPGVDATTSLEGDERSRPLVGKVADWSLLDHVALSKLHDLVDFESATATTGSRWYYLKNEAALLELALIQYATQRAVKAGFTPVITPDVVRAEVVAGCGFQPRDAASQTYWVSTIDPSTSRQVTGQHQHPSLCLVATAEIALAGMNMNKVLDSDQLPLRLAGFGRAFRAEAGSRGAEVKGLYRVHQFSKVELFVVSKATPGASDAILEELRKFQEETFEELGLCFRVLDMPTEELGASAYKKYDIEAWMPGRSNWGEISSTSNCTDYQSRRLNIRYRVNNNHTKDTSAFADNQVVSTSSSPSSPSTEFAHTLNGTAIAVPRIIVALLETHQQKDGSINLPECLWPFMAGIKTIRPKGSTKA